MNKGRGKLLQSESSAGHCNLHVSERRVHTAARANAAEKLAADSAGGGSHRQALFQRRNLVFSCGASLVDSLDFGHDTAGLRAAVHALFQGWNTQKQKKHKRT